MALRFIALAFLIGCVSIPHVPPKIRTYKDQAETTVTVKLWCDKFSEGMYGDLQAGSGVIVDERHVITAWHVVKCPGFSTLPIIQVGLQDGRAFMMVIDKVDGDADLALLTIFSADRFHLKVPPPVIGKAEAGDSACSSVGFPKKGWHCGEIASVSDSKKGNIEVDAETVSGNSGSALYNSSGQLVGIIVQRQSCPGEKTQDCIGYATSLKGRFKFYPK